MRAAERIDGFLERIGKVWKQYPDFRFGQFMTVFQSQCGGDFFQLEEEEFIKKIEEQFGIEEKVYIVHSFTSGVYVGKFVRADDSFTVLKDARRITNIDSGLSLFELAKNGPSEKIKITEEAKEVIINSASEMVLCSKEAIRKFNNWGKEEK